MTPTTLDFLGNYSDAIDGCPFVLDQVADTTLQQNKLVVLMLGATESTIDNGNNKFSGTRPRSFISYPSNL